MTQIQQLRKGSTVLLVLSILEGETKYGYQIMRELERRSEGYFTMTAALLYPTLHRLEKEGLVKSEWREGQSERRRKYYTITEAGRRVLLERTEAWQTFFQKLFETLSSQQPLVEAKLS
jgi:PadR family transcriptional regulator PadR